MNKTEKFLNRFWAKVAPVDIERKSKQKPPEGVSKIADIPYINDGNPAHTLDIYAPAGTVTKLPVVINIHGGGWTYGSKEINEYYAMNIAKRGFVVVGANYRLLQETRLGNMYEDILAVFNFVMTAGSEYCMDLNNIFICGDSAGGCLAVVSAAIANQPEDLQVLMEYKTDLRPRAVAASCGALAMERYDWMRMINGFYEMAFGYEKRASRYHHLLFPRRIINVKTFPPVFLNSAYGDFVRKHTKSFVKYLKNNNMEHECLFIKKKEAKDKLKHVYDVLYPERPDSVRTIDAMTEFFKKHIK